MSIYLLPVENSWGEEIYIDSNKVIAVEPKTKRNGDAILVVSLSACDKQFWLADTSKNRTMLGV